MLVFSTDLALLITRVLAETNARESHYFQEKRERERGKLVDWLL